MPLYTQHLAWFFDGKGEFHGHKTFNKNQKTFQYGEGSYNIDIENSSIVESMVIPFIWRRRRYFYNIKYSNPLKLSSTTNEPSISPELYNANLEIKLAKELGDLAKGFLAKLLTPRNIIIALILFGIIYWFGTKQKPPTPTG